MKRKPNRDAGYSLLEILVVLTIMSVLATFVAPRLFSHVDGSKITAAKSQAKSLRLALDAYRLDTGAYPTDAQGLQSLITPPQDDNPSWAGPYMEGELPKDPWGSDFIYKAPQFDANNRALSPKVISYGADKAEGGSGSNADISS